MSFESERTRARNTCLWKLGILLLLAGLVSVSALAKNSFELPRSSPSHWVSQACKMCEGCRVTPPRAAAYQAVIAALHAIPPTRHVFENQPSYQPPPLIPDFFRDATLRSPPAA